MSILKKTQDNVLRISIKGISLIKKIKLNMFSIILAIELMCNFYMQMYEIKTFI